MILSTHGIVGSQITQFVGLLDAYPNAAAAYSLRKLRTAYTGSAIKVRNSSNSELDIGFVNNVLDTASLLTHCGSGNGFVTTWYDQSGNGRNATQTTASNQPQIVSSGSVNQYKSINAIIFNGTSNYFSLTTSMTENIAIISAHEDGTQQSGGSLHKSLFATTSDCYNAYSTGYGLSKRRENSNGSSFATSSIDASEKSISVAYSKTDNKELLYAEANNGNYQLFKNNSSLGSGTYTPRTTSFDTTYSIGVNLGGTARYYMGNLYEIITYNFNQSSNRTGIESNINNFYSIY